MAKKTQSQDEKLIELYYKGVEYFQNNTKQVYIALTIVVAIIAGIVFYTMSQKEKRENASIELTKVQDVYSMGAYQQAINGDSLGYSKGLLYIVNEYGSTESGEIAKIMLANSYYYLMDYSNAERYFNDYSGSDVILKAASIAGIAAIREAQGNFVEAAQKYEEAAGVSEDVAVNDEYLYAAARNYSLANNVEEYKRVSGLLKSEYPQSSYIFKLQRYELN